MSDVRHTLVHPTDFSEGTQPALSLALNTARRHDAELLLVHVLQPAAPIGDVGLARGVDARAEAEAAARREFDRLLHVAKEAGVHASDVLLDGAPAVEIARVAKERKASLIVMAAPGRSTVRVGCARGVTEDVIVMAPCWVVVVRGALGVRPCAA
ncbi:MAG TPA: universal stress protein [Methylomirabilota bacterium]|jgi:nucleotide-binding universal stress UspA family protein